ncbi:glycosyltransferase family 4 protein [Micromonospora sp. NBC_01813]|uniref:glycosyltransferase family 4 protein n=1 Tax=Micromonospora sp. NBC_01813 TaxID=2975988 RepID=UPI002DD84168|nr:glycosyltransferase [Micromonospora sp. NBC_01813]WSA10306.1 glycosyltransferase family 4 protein [Micromonospora sp. NBC_01813]
MGLTVVSTYFPLPTDRGDPVRVLMILRAIALTRPYTLRVVRRPDTTDAQVDELRALLPGVRVYDYQATPYRSDRLGPLGRYPESFAVGLPPWVRTRYSRELHADLFSDTGSGIAIGEAAAAYLPGTRLRWHWDKANVLAASSEQDIAEAPNPVHRMRARYLAGISTRFEERSLAHCATVSVTSEEEAHRLHGRHGRVADFILASCVPLPVDHLPRPQPGRLVWLSSFAYLPNLLGLRRFLDEGWERLHRAGYQLTLIGSGLTDPVRDELASHPGVELLGFVDDLRPVLALASAAVVPVFSGAGVKLKTLTLLAHGLPVFSTPVGAEGVPPSEAVSRGQTPAEIADAILGTSPMQLHRMATAAVDLVSRQFSARQFEIHLIESLRRTGYLRVGALDEGA